MLIHKSDNVEVQLETGHKYAIRPIKAGENVIKYGNPIGHATADIKAGEHVHTHNLKTNLSDKLEYTYAPAPLNFERKESDLTFMGYLRENGEVGIRNDVWIVKGEKEYMIPAVKAFVLDTDVDAGTMHVRLIEGMEVNAN